MTETPTLAPLQIFLAEDNPGDALLIQESLLENGCDHVLQMVDDGEKAIEFLERVEQGLVACPDVFLLDLNLPRRTGTEVLARARATAACRTALIIILTSSDAPRDRAEAKRLGADYYFRKPSSLEELLQLGAIIGDLVSRHRSTSDTKGSRT